MCGTKMIQINSDNVVFRQRCVEQRIEIGFQI
jgi:hypothetical protein